MTKLVGYDYPRYNSAGWNSAQPYYQQVAQGQPYQQVMPSQTVASGQMSTAQPVNWLIRVTGEDGAKAFSLPPNSAIALFDANEDIMYIKTTDGAGFPTIVVCDYYPRARQKTKPEEYVTRSEFEQLKEMVTGGKQPFQHVPAV